MTRSSNGMTMSGSGLFRWSWHPNARGHGPKSPWKKYKAVSGTYRVRRHVGTHEFVNSFKEPEHVFEIIGSFKMHELRSAVRYGHVLDDDQVQQEDGVGWVVVRDFMQRAPRKKASKAKRPWPRKTRSRKSRLKRPGRVKRGRKRPKYKTR